MLGLLNRLNEPRSMFIGSFFNASEVLSASEMVLQNQVY